MRLQPLSVGALQLRFCARAAGIHGLRGMGRAGSAGRDRRSRTRPMPAATWRRGHQIFASNGCGWCHEGWGARPGAWPAAHGHEAERRIHRQPDRHRVARPHAVVRAGHGRPEAQGPDRLHPFDQAGG